MQSPKKVMVYRTGHLGDTVCAIPAFRLIRKVFADSELSLLCDRPKGAMVAASEVIDKLGIFERILTYTSNRQISTILELVRALYQARPDLVIILPQERENQKSLRWKKRFFKFCGAGEVLGCRSVTSRHAWQPTEADRLIEMLNSVGVEGLKPAYNIPIDVKSRESIKVKLHAAGVDVKKPFLLFCGGGKEVTQRWPIERYTAVLPCLAAATQWPILGLGSPQEVKAYRDRILPEFPELRLFTQPLSIIEIFELCRLASACFGNDTGPLHAASSVGCPVAVVMSARNLPGTWHPDVQPNLVIRLRMECEGCFLKECIEKQHRCMTDITVDQVVTEVIPFLKSLPKR